MVLFLCKLCVTGIKLRFKKASIPEIGEMEVVYRDRVFVYQFH